MAETSNPLRAEHYATDREWAIALTAEIERLAREYVHYADCLRKQSKLLYEVQNERDEWARKWHRARAELAELKYPGMKGVIRPKDSPNETSGYSQAYADHMREALLPIETSSLTPDRVRQFAHKGLLPPSGSSQKAGGESPPERPVNCLNCGPEES